ncbi:MAG: hypothetical protein U5L00_07690 [Desulfovermiculus sp.]|nr:hypothetical protein [Desulfovermiculus sp.]
MPFMEEALQNTLGLSGTGLVIVCLAFVLVCLLLFGPDGVNSSAIMAPILIIFFICLLLGGAIKSLAVIFLPIGVLLFILLVGTFIQIFK